MLRYEDSIFLNKITVPQNTFVLSNAIKVGGTRQRLEVVVEIDEPLTISSGKSLTVELWGSDTVDGTFTKTVTIGTVTNNTIRFPIGYSFSPFAKIKVISDDTSAAGKISAFVGWVA